MGEAGARPAGSRRRRYDSAGAEIVADTRRGRTYGPGGDVDTQAAQQGAEGWIPEHFYAEVLGVLRRQLLVEKLLTDAKATAAVVRLRSWHLHCASVAPLVGAAWAYRHNMTAADALYVTLAEQLGADFLTDDHRLADSPTFLAGVKVLRLPTRS